MTAKKPHPDYLAHPDHQWQGELLGALLPALTLELATHDNVGSVWRVLRGGALVSLGRDGESGKRVLRIRRSSCKDEDAKQKFLLEVDVFRSKLGVRKWAREIDRETKGIGVLLLEP